MSEPDRTWDGLYRSPALEAPGASVGLRASEIASQYFDAPGIPATEIASRFFDAPGIRAAEIAAKFFESPLPSNNERYTAASVPAFDFLSDRWADTAAAAIGASVSGRPLEGFAKSVLYDESGAFKDAFKPTGIESWFEYLQPAGIPSVKGYRSAWTDWVIGDSVAGSASAWLNDLNKPAADFLEGIGAKALGWESMRDYEPFGSVLKGLSRPTGTAVDSLMSSFAVSSPASDLAHRLLKDLDEGLQPFSESLLEPVTLSRLPEDEPELDDAGRMSRFRVWWATLTFEQKLAFTQFVVTSLEFVAMVTFGIFEIMASQPPQQITNIYDNDVSVHHTTVNNTTIHQTTVVQAPVREAP